MIKILLLIIVGCIISVVLKQYCKEYLLLFQIGFSLMLLIHIFDQTFDEIDVFSGIISGIANGSEIMKVLLKASAVSVATKLGCDICRESNNLLLEDVFELGGRLMIFVLSVPYILKLINIAIGYL